MSKEMCVWCKRGPHKPHLENCPDLTGIQPRSNPREKKPGAPYLRRGREGTAFLPPILYLAEPPLMLDPDSPAGLYHGDTAFRRVPK